MTDERDPREPEPASTDATEASDLPAPAEDRSATAELAAGNGSEPREGDGAEPAPDPEPQTVAVEPEEAGEVRVEVKDEPLGEETASEDAAPAAGSAEDAAGGEEERGEADGDAETAAADEPVRSTSPEEPPAADGASAAEDASGRPDAGVSHEAAPPRPSDVSAETSSEAAVAEEVTEKEAEPSGTASRPPAEEAPQPAAESAPERRTAATDDPAAEPPSPPPAESVPEPAAEPAPEAQAATTDGPAAEQPAAEPVAAAEPETAPEEKPEAAPEPAVPEDPALAELKRAKEEGTAVEGKVIGWNRGGFHVVVGEVTAFCPSSEMELGRPRSPQSYVDRTLTFRVVKFQKKGRRVVLSRAAVLGEERKRVVGRLEPGAVVRGKVTSLPDFGAFVDLGGVEGLVHVSEISRGRVKSPKEALQVGQEVEVKVLKVEQEGERISLSMKDLEPDPWQGVAQRYPRGEKFPGKIARRADFGLFVELEPEVEGLVHVSQLPPGVELGDPSLDPGTEIEVWVREVDRKRQRISLSLREIPSEDPWKDAAKRFPEGEMVEGTVESIAPFGVFVNLAPGLTGLLPGSQTGLPKGTSAARAFSPGQKVRVQVLSIDPRRKRISLGREGSRVEATRTDLQDFKKQQREREQEAPTAMAAAFARLREEREEPGKSQKS